MNEHERMNLWWRRATDAEKRLEDVLADLATEIEEWRTNAQASSHTDGLLCHEFADDLQDLYDRHRAAYDQHRAATKPIGIESMIGTYSDETGPWFRLDDWMEGR